MCRAASAIVRACPRDAAGMMKVVHQAIVAAALCCSADSAEAHAAARAQTKAVLLVVADDLGERRRQQQQQCLARMNRSAQQFSDEYGPYQKLRDLVFRVQ